MTQWGFTPTHVYEAQKKQKKIDLNWCLAYKPWANVSGRFYCWLTGGNRSLKLQTFCKGMRNCWARSSLPMPMVRSKKFHHSERGRCTSKASNSAVSQAPGAGADPRGHWRPLECFCLIFLNACSREVHQSWPFNFAKHFETRRTEIRCWRLPARCWKRWSGLLVQAVPTRSASGWLCCFLRRSRIGFPTLDCHTVATVHNQTLSSLKVGFMLLEIQISWQAPWSVLCSVNSPCCTACTFH
jgi:hypothetical protein